MGSGPGTIDNDFSATRGSDDDMPQGEATVDPTDRSDASTIQQSTTHDDEADFRTQQNSTSKFLTPEEPDGERKRPSPKPRTTLYTLCADAGSVLLPLALLGFLLAVLQLHGDEASNQSLARWQNAITVVSNFIRREITNDGGHASSDQGLTHPLLS